MTPCHAKRKIERKELVGHSGELTKKQREKIELGKGTSDLSHLKFNNEAKRKKKVNCFKRYYTRLKDFYEDSMRRSRLG
jgi:uncharacterized protein YdgA (DUF945 family)